jgi:hypothetical protein
MKRKNMKPKTLDEIIRELDPYLAKRLARLNGTPREIAELGIVRHLAACDRVAMQPDFRAVREIIDDALNGQAIYAQAAP